MGKGHLLQDLGCRVAQLKDTSNYTISYVNSSPWNSTCNVMMSPGCALLSKVHILLPSATFGVCLISCLWGSIVYSRSYNNLRSVLSEQKLTIKSSFRYHPSSEHCCCVDMTKASVPHGTHSTGCDPSKAGDFGPLVYGYGDHIFSNKNQDKWSGKGLFMVCEYILKESYK